GGGDRGRRVEEQGPVVGRIQRQQMDAELRLDALVEGEEVGRLPGEAGAVVDDLERQLALARVELHAAITRPDTPARWAFARSPGLRPPSPRVKSSVPGSFSRTDDTAKSL